MPKGYWIARVDVENAEAYAKYRSLNAVAFAKVYVGVLNDYLFDRYGYELGAAPGPELESAHQAVPRPTAIDAHVPRQLPLDVRGFTGREAELSALDRFLDEADGLVLAVVSGTAGVGTCTQGTQTCASNGQWGACEGQVIPTGEVCGNGLDDNCDGMVDEDVDADGDGCSTRNEVLISEADDPVTVGSGCALSGGRWFSYYDGVSQYAAGNLDIDHMVPLAEAWDSGARAGRRRPVGCSPTTSATAARWSR